jgi:hypothetical protein
MEAEDPTEPNRFTIPGRIIFEPDPENAPGHFYVAFGCCLSCEAPEDEAPMLMGRRKGEWGGCFFKKQPSTPEELEKAISAIEVSCIPALRYAGVDPGIHRRLEVKGLLERCDTLIPEEKIPPTDVDPFTRMVTLDRALNPWQDVKARANRVSR